MRLRNILLGALILRLALALLYPISGDACSHHNTVVLLQQTLGPIDELSRGPVWWPYFYHGILALLLYPFAKYAALLALGIDLANVLMGVLGVYMTYLLTKELTRKEDIALLAAGIIALFPVHVFYSAVLYTDVPLFAFLSLFMYFSLKERPVLASIFGACAIMSKFNGIIVFPLLGIIFLSKKTRWTLPWWKTLCAIGILTLIFGSGFMIRNTILFGHPISFGAGSGALGRDSALFENLNLGILWQQYLTFFAVPGGNLANVIAYLPLPSWMIPLLVVAWLLCSILLLIPFVLSYVYARKYAMVVGFVGIIVALHIYGMMRLGSETGFRYSMIFLFPFAFFTALTLRSWTKWRFAFFLLLSFFCVPLFLQAYLAHNQLDERVGLYTYIASLPKETRIFGFQPCVMAHTGRTIEMIPYVDKAEYLGPSKVADYILLNPSDPTTMETKRLSQIYDEYSPVISSQGMTLLKRKT